MKEKLDVTVVVPFYNRSYFTDRLLRSVFDQNHLPEEILLIDNGSNFEECLKCATVLFRYLGLGVEINFFSTLKKGNANYARQLGFDLAKTKYIAYLDSDDWWESEHLTVAIKTLKKTNKIAYYCGANIHRGHVEVRNACGLEDSTSVFDFLLIDKKIAQTSSYVVVKDKVSNNKIIWDQRLKRNQDYDYFLSIHTIANGWCFSERALTNIDWNYGGAGSEIDFKSMIRFVNKWHDLMSKDILLKYLSSSLIELVARKANVKYIKYYACRINRLSNATRRLCNFYPIKLILIGLVKKIFIHFKLINAIYWISDRLLSRRTLKID